MEHEAWTWLRNETKKYRSFKLFAPDADITRLKNIDDGDISLVEMIEGTPHCKNHGAMCKVDSKGTWRCVGIYKKDAPSITPKGKKIPGKFYDGVCRAACFITK